MEDMDFDQVVDVPDTPDRLPSRQTIGRGSVGKDCNSTLAGNCRNMDSVHGLSGRGKPVTENGVRRKIVFRPPRFGKVERQDSNNSNGFPTVENLSASQNAHLFRRPAVGKNHSHKAKQSIEAQNMDKGKPMCSKFPSKSSIFQEGTAFFDLTKQDGHTQPSKKGFSHGELKYLVPEETNRGQIASNGSSFVSDSVKTSRNAFKGKGKMDDNSVKGSALAMAHGNGVDSQYKSGEQMNVSRPVTSPRVSGQKRLVRNGCISPLNIETKAKQLAEQQNNTSKIVEQNQAGKVISNHPSPCYMDTSDIITKDDNSEKVKGKTIVIDPYRLSKEHKAKFVPASSSVPVIENGEANGTSAASGDAFGCSTGIGGWRSTRNPSRNVDHPLPDTARHLSRRSDGSGVNCRTKCDQTEDQNAAQTVSWPVSDLERTTGPPRAGKTIIKRQRNQGSSSRNAGECSTSISEDSDIMIIGSSRGSLKSKSSGVCSPQSQVTLGPVIEIDELSPAVRNTRSQSIDDLDNDDTEARARQVEADEILARELQEQLYHEGPIVGGREIDEHMAWALQQEENGIHNSAGSQNESHPRGSTISQLNRQHWSRSSQNLSSRRGTQNRVPTATRMVQLRNRFHRQAHAVSTRARNVQFPLDMDLDMRIDMLEALEAAVEDHSDVGTRRRATNIFRAQRDFNENDYEMLLALDENNHQHAGASVNQINSLPQSMVQVETLEACAICLETPTMGEIVRHLPCLHKFHKDCIDPWLCRKTSCPVCKCSVT